MATGTGNNRGGSRSTRKTTGTKRASGAGTRGASAGRARQTSARGASPRAAQTRRTAGNGRRGSYYEEQDFALKYELLLIVLFAGMVFLFLANFGVMGAAGNAVSGVLFGLFGFPAYLLPVFLFFLAAFWISNRESESIGLKIGAAIALFLVFGVVCEMITHPLGQSPTYQITEIFKRCAEGKTGGGVLEGSLAFLFYRLLKTVGTVLLLIVVVLLCVVILTERSLFGAIREGRESWENRRAAGEDELPWEPDGQEAEDDREPLPRRNASPFADGYEAWRRSRADRRDRREAQQREREQERTRRETERHERLAQIEQEQAMAAEARENDRILRMDRKGGGFHINTLVPEPENGAAASGEAAGEGRMEESTGAAGQSTAAQDGAQSGEARSAAISAEEYRALGRSAAGRENGSPTGAAAPEIDLQGRPARHPVMPERPQDEMHEITVDDLALRALQTPIDPLPAAAAAATPDIGVLPPADLSPDYTSEAFADRIIRSGYEESAARERGGQAIPYQNPYETADGGSGGLYSRAVAASAPQEVQPWEDGEIAAQEMQPLEAGEAASQEPQPWEDGEPAAQEMQPWEAREAAAQEPLPWDDDDAGRQAAETETHRFAAVSDGNASYRAASPEAAAPYDSASTQEDSQSRDAQHVNAEHSFARQGQADDTAPRREDAAADRDRTPVTVQAQRVSADGDMEEITVHRERPQEQRQGASGGAHTGAGFSGLSGAARPHGHGRDRRRYEYPPVSLLKPGRQTKSPESDRVLKETALRLQETLRTFGVNVTITDISQGPSVTRYELQPEQGVKVSRIVSLQDDIKLNLAATDIRIEAPIPGKAAIGIEVPNKETTTVAFRDLIESPEFVKSQSRLSFAVGKDIGGKTVVTDIAKMPHLLIAGSTGSGKSVCINTLIMSILYKASPEEVKLIMVDPKVVELSVYNGIPHLMIPVVTDPKKAAAALNWAVAEMTKRYQRFADAKVRDLKGYNAAAKEAGAGSGMKVMPQIVIVVDELADLMMVSANEVEEAICRLAQLARAAGIHLIIATQRPSVDVITGLIKANMPSRIAFAVSSGVDSRTILDMNGAEKLLGKGDMLFYPQGYPKPARIQGAFISDQEVGDVAAFLKKGNEQANGENEIEKAIEELASGAGGASAAAAGASGGGWDEHFADAGRFVIEKDKASIGMLQRVYKIGFNRAARIMDQLCDAGVVSAEEGTKPRRVLMSPEEFEAYLDNNT